LNSNPLQFGGFLLKQCEAMGVKVLRNATVTKVHTKHQDEKSIIGVTVLEGSRSRSLPCDSLIISAGPWSERVLAGLFPKARVRIPLNVTTAGNHILVKTPRWKATDDEKGCDQVYMADILGHSLDISSFLGGTLYVGGYGADPEELPKLSTQVQAQPNAIAAMTDLSHKALDIPLNAGLEILNVGRCYRRMVEQGRPIMTKVPLSLLYERPEADQHGDRVSGTGGVYLNVGHGSDGITLGPGSGKVMSELIRGVDTSVDISGLGLGSS